MIARFIRVRSTGVAGRPAARVLTRMRRACDHTRRRGLRLPVEVSGGAAFAQSTAVTALADLLRALTDPTTGPRWWASCAAPSSG